MNLNVSKNVHIHKQSIVPPEAQQRLNNLENRLLNPLPNKPNDTTLSNIQQAQENQEKLLIHQMSGSMDQHFGNQSIGTTMSINSNMVMSINTGTMGRNSKLSDSVHNQNTASMNSASNQGRVIIDSYPKIKPKKQSDFNDVYYDIRGF